MNNTLEEIQTQLHVLERRKFHNKTTNQHLKIQLENFTITYASKLKVTILYIMYNRHQPICICNIDIL